MARQRFYRYLTSEGLRVPYTQVAFLKAVHCMGQYHGLPTPGTVRLVISPGGEVASCCGFDGAALTTANVKHFLTSNILSLFPVGCNVT